MSSDGLSREQSFALIFETTSTRNLLAYGIRALRTAAFFETTMDPILSMLSIGTEKLYKLALGFTSLDRTGSWPPKSEAVGHGHAIAAMHPLLLDALRTGTAGRDYAAGLIADVEADAVVIPLIMALDRYGRSGRFYNLDLLGSDPQKWQDPRDLWAEVDATALSDRDVLAAFATAGQDLSDGAAWNAAHRAVNARVAAAAERLWIMVADCGKNGALGQAGRSFGHEVHPRSVGRQVLEDDPPS